MSRHNHSGLMQIYQVGGAVRDELLGLEVKDRDWVVTGATPQQLLDLGYRQVGRDFPVFLHPESGEEYALARTERKTAPGYRGFRFNAASGVTLAEDLRRRDLTINAIARDSNGRLIDPHHGQADLKARIIRHISPAFAEDPLRVLRVARFSARLGFAVATETQGLMRDIAASGELATIAAERIWAETAKALAGEQPRRYFHVLRDCGALAVILPEIDGLFGVPQPYHPHIDCGAGALMALDIASGLSGQPIVRFAALVHNLGKAATQQATIPPSERGVAIIEGLAERLKLPSKYRELAVLVSRHHLDCHRIDTLPPAAVLARLEALDALRRPQRFRQFLLACEASYISDYKTNPSGHKDIEDKPYHQADFFLGCLEASAAVDSKPLLAEGLTGEQLAAAIRQQRIAAIKSLNVKLRNL